MADRRCYASRSQMRLGRWAAHLLRQINAGAPAAKNWSKTNLEKKVKKQLPNLRIFHRSCSQMFCGPALLPVLIFSEVGLLKVL
jgi:hypothetical protein